MSNSASFLSFLIPVAVVGIMLLVFGRVFLRYRNNRKLLQTGDLTVADVLSSSQTGVTINSQPEMRVVLDVENVGGTPRRVEVRQVLDLGRIPRAGDRVYVLVDPTNPANVVLAPPSAAAQVRTAMSSAGMALTDAQAQDMLALNPALQQVANLNVIKVVSVGPGPAGTTQFVADVDAIGQPLRRVTFSQVVHGAAPAAGARTYVFIDPAHPDTVALVPLSLMQGQSLPAGANRLDALVLGPQLLRVGAQGTAVVSSARQVELGEPALAAKGVTKWELGLAVTPADGTPAYTAPLTISLLSQERVARITPVGGQLPVRYDPLDPQTVSIDGLALGYPDPYADLQKLLQQQLG